MDRKMRRKIFLAVVCLYLKTLSLLADEIMGLRGITQDKKQWVEAEHNRKRNGQFGEGGGAAKENKRKGSFYGTNVFVDNATKIEYNAIFSGTVTSNGIKIKSVSGHSVGRMIERKITPEQAKNILTSENSKIYQGHTTRTVCFRKGNVYLVVDKIRGRIVTVVV